MFTHNIISGEGGGVKLNTEHFTSTLHVKGKVITTDCPKCSLPIQIKPLPLHLPTYKYTHAHAHYTYRQVLHKKRAHLIPPLYIVKVIETAIKSSSLLSFRKYMAFLSMSMNDNILKIYETINQIFNAVTFLNHIQSIKHLTPLFNENDLICNSLRINKFHKYELLKTVRKISVKPRRDLKCSRLTRLLVHTIHRVRYLSHCFPGERSTCTEVYLIVPANESHWGLSIL